MNQFEQFGIKEVADVQFIALEADTRLDVAAGDVVLYLDTLKISTLETTAEQTEARGGRGNPSLIIWDYGKEITVTLQDALFTPESLLVMTGGVKKISGADSPVSIRRTKLVSKAEDLPTTYPYSWIDTKGGERGTATAAAEGVPSEFPVRVFYDEEVVTADAAYEVTIDAANFPGTYKIVGDTVVRNRNGKDTPFQFVIPKAKLGSEVTFTMEAKPFGLVKSCELLEIAA
jgi:hypothetical protein